MSDLQRTRPAKLPEIPEHGVAQEMLFWDDWFAHEGGQYAEDYRFRLDPATELQEFIAMTLAVPAGVTLEVLDVGAGPLTFLGKNWRRRPLRITALDPLANLYDEVLDRHRIEPPVRTRHGRAEDLESRFGPDRFDMVHARNCIDHSQDPVLAIDELVRVAKPGGVVFLHHATNEADRQNFDGFHQWNLHGEDGRFLISDRTRRTDVTARLAPVADVETQLHGDGEWMINIIRKRHR